MNIKWDITYKCNLNCKHCINGDYLGQIENELCFNEIQIILRKLHEVKVNYIHLLGGEPTARADIGKIFEEFCINNINFGFNTNGLKLTDPTFRRSIVKNINLKNIVFSLEGPTAEINDSIRGKKVFEITTNNIREIVKLKREFKREDLVLTINTVVNKINYNYIIDMIYFAKNIGVDEMVLLQFIQEGNGKELDETLSVEQEISLVKDIAYCYKEVKNDLSIRPRFIYPLAQKYVKEMYELEFPSTYSMCGAGENFFYLNIGNC